MSGSLLDMANEDMMGEVSIADFTKQGINEDVNAALREVDGEKEDLDRRSNAEQLNPDFYDLAVSSAQQSCAIQLQKPLVEVKDANEPTRGSPRFMSPLSVTKGNSNPPMSRNPTENSEESDSDDTETLQMDAVRQSVRYAREKKSSIIRSLLSPSTSTVSHSAILKPYIELETPNKTEPCFPQQQISSEVSEAQKGTIQPSEEYFGKISDSKEPTDDTRPSFLYADSGSANLTSVNIADRLTCVPKPNTHFKKLLAFFGSSDSSARNKLGVFEHLRGGSTPVKTGEQEPGSSKVNESTLRMTPLKDENLGCENTLPMKPWARLKQAIGTKKTIVSGPKTEGQGSSNDKSAGKSGFRWVQKALTSMKKPNEEVPEEIPMCTIDTFNTILDEEM